MRDELLNSIQSQVELLTKLIEDILHVSRLDDGIVETQLEPLDLGALVAQLLVELHPLAQAKQIALNYTKSTKGPLVQVNPEHLERVIRNLIENAIKYTPSGGSIQVQTVSELRDNQEFVGVQVADNGIGIPPEFHSQIFDRFYRVDPSHTIPGTGLGLSIVKEIISAYGGDVHLESKPGVGSTFVVAIPRVSGKVAA
jgi:signal transduction histidine kinase